MTRHITIPGILAALLTLTALACDDKAPTPDSASATETGDTEGGDTDSTPTGSSGQEGSSESEEAPTTGYQGECRGATCEFSFGQFCADGLGCTEDDQTGICQPKCSFQPDDCEGYPDACKVGGSGIPLCNLTPWIDCAPPMAPAQ